VNQEHKNDRRMGTRVFRIPYKDLSIVMGKFHEENILGQGGFSKVYKGVLPSSDQEVAVKCITKDFSEGMKVFVVEISSMGRPQHCNFVRLHGWCRRYKQFQQQSCRGLDNTRS